MTLLELSRERWSAALLRRFADTLLECEAGRALSPQHEARWLNLLGYCLRPGYGDPVDEWRMKQVWKLFPQGLRFPRQAQSRSEWWVFWRRVAGGLNTGQQYFIYQQLTPYFAATGEKKKTAGKPARKAAPQEMVEIWMALANFERLPLEAKTELGGYCFRASSKGAWKAQELWALEPYRGTHPLLRSSESRGGGQRGAHLGETPDEALPRPTTDAAQALVNLVRPSGDRARDLPRDEYRTASPLGFSHCPMPVAIRAFDSGRCPPGPEGTGLDLRRISPGGVENCRARKLLSSCAVSAYSKNFGSCPLLPDGRFQALLQRPRKTGGRFCRNACIPS